MQNVIEGFNNWLSLAGTSWPQHPTGGPSWRWNHCGHFSILMEYNAWLHWPYFLHLTKGYIMAIGIILVSNIWHLYIKIVHYQALQELRFGVLLRHLALRQCSPACTWLVQREIWQFGEVCFVSRTSSVRSWEISFQLLLFLSFNYLSLAVLWSISFAVGWVVDPTVWLLLSTLLMSVDCNFPMSWLEFVYVLWFK